MNLGNTVLSFNPSLQKNISEYCVRNVRTRRKKIHFICLHHAFLPQFAITMEYLSTTTTTSKNTSRILFSSHLLLFYQSYSFVIVNELNPSSSKSSILSFLGHSLKTLFFFYLSHVFSFEMKLILSSMSPVILDNYLEHFPVLWFNFVWTESKQEFRIKIFRSHLNRLRIVKHNLQNLFR